GQVDLTGSVGAVLAIRAVPDAARLEVVEDEGADRSGGDVEAHREADLVKVGRGREGGPGQPDPAPLSMGADLHGSVDAAEQVLREADVFCFEELAHLAPQVRSGRPGGTPNRCRQAAPLTTPARWTGTIPEFENPS